MKFFLEKNALSKLKKKTPNLILVKNNNQPKNNLNGVNLKSSEFMFFFQKNPIKKLISMSQRCGLKNKYVGFFGFILKNFIFKKNFEKTNSFLLDESLNKKKNINYLIYDLVQILKPVLIIKFLKVKKKKIKKRKIKKNKFLKKITYAKDYKRVNMVYKYLYLNSLTFKNDSMFKNRMFKSLFYQIAESKNSKFYKMKIKVFRNYYSRKWKK